MSAKPNFPTVTTMCVLWMRSEERNEDEKVMGNGRSECTVRSSVKLYNYSLDPLIQVL